MSILGILRKARGSGCSFESLLRARSPRLLLHTCTLPSDGEKASSEDGVPPVPHKRPFERWKHGLRWHDPYHWMRVDQQAATKQLCRENRYAEAFMADTLSLQRTLEKEMAGRLQREDVSSPPERIGSWLYYMILPEGKEYPVYCRRKSAPAGHAARQLHWRRAASTVGWFNEKEEILLDLNSLVEQFGYAQLGTCRISRDHSFMAFTLDTTGTEAFSLYMKDLRTGQVINRKITDSVVSVEWAANGRSVYFTVADSLLRPWRVLSHSLTAVVEDVLIFEEKDASRFVDVSRTKDWSFITLNINSKTSSEVYLLDGRDSLDGLQLVQERKSGVQYFVEHHQGLLYMLTNDDRDNDFNANATNNYRLVCSSLDRLGPGNLWQEVAGPDPNAIIEDMEMFEKYLVLYMRRDGLPIIQVMELPWVRSLDVSTRVRTLSLPQQICTVIPGANEDFQSSFLRVSVSSPIMPEAVLEYDLNSGESAVLQQSEVVGRTPSCQGGAILSKSQGLVSFLRSTLPANWIVGDKGHEVRRKTRKDVIDFSEEYVCQRHEAIHADGVAVPLTVVHSRDLERNGQNPALLIGYGAYGQALEVEWCSERLSLLDRGWVVAFAHVRGGGELGKVWHQWGRLLKKRNSFLDFVCAAEYLIDQKYADRHKIGGWGVSAGGLLVASAVNLRPDLFRAIVLEVPFLDISNTLLDKDLPLSVHEYDEWGNPDDEEAFALMRSYSPYDNIQSGTPLPAALVKSGYLDSRVGYWEAAKWVARVRDSTGPTSSNVVLLKTSMDTGHFAEGGRFGRLKDIAHDYSFLIKMMG